MTTRRRKKDSVGEIMPAAPQPVEGVIWAGDTTLSPITWLLPGILPASALTLVEGRKGTGKSSVMASWAAAISGGPAPPGWIGPRDRRVLWFCAEEDWGSQVLPRLLGAGCPRDRVGCLALTDIQHKIRPPALPRDATAISDLLFIADIGLLVIDGYSSVLGAGLSTSQDQQVRQAWEPLVPALAANRCACVTSRHLRKGTSGDVTEHGLASGAIMHIARITHRCDRHPTDRGLYTLSTVARSFGSPVPTQTYCLHPTDLDTVRVEWLGASPLDAESIAEGRGSEAERDEWQDADRLLAQVIGGGWVVVGAIIAEAEKAGITPRMLRRAKARLGLPSRRVSYGGDGYWEWGAPAGGWPSSLTSDMLSNPPPPPQGAPKAAPVEETSKNHRRRSKAPKAPSDGGGAPSDPKAPIPEDSNGETATT